MEPSRPNSNHQNNPSFASGKNGKDFIKSIENNPQYQHLVEKAKAPLEKPEKPSFLQETLKLILELIIANSRDFHGQAFVSENLVKDAKNTARLVTVSSAIDASGNFSLVFYAFKDMGVLAIPFTLLTTALILKFTNDTAAAASARKSQGKAWSNLGIVGFILMSVLQSIVSGIGMELLLNQSGLSQFKAQQLIQEQTQRVESLQEIDNPQYKDALTRCKNGEKELNSFVDKEHPRRNSLYVQLYGTYEQHNANWNNVSVEQLPLCRQVDRLRQEAYQPYEIAKKHWQQLLIDRASMGNDLAFIQEKMPLVYRQHFTASGKLDSGIEATRLAILSFISKWTGGEWAGLGFSLFFLLLSIVTSGVACGSTITLSYRKDTQKSFSETVQLHRDIWLETRRKELLMAHKNHLDN
jgi:hypothetical protein